RAATTDRGTDDQLPEPSGDGDPEPRKRHHLDRGEDATAAGERAVADIGIIRQAVTSPVRVSDACGGTRRRDRQSIGSRAPISRGAETPRNRARGGVSADQRVSGDAVPDARAGAAL